MSSNAGSAGKFQDGLPWASRMAGNASLLIGLRRNDCARSESGTFILFGGVGTQEDDSNGVAVLSEVLCTSLQRIKLGIWRRSDLSSFSGSRKQCKYPP